MYGNAMGDSSSGDTILVRTGKVVLVQRVESPSRGVPGTPCQTPAITFCGQAADVLVMVSDMLKPKPELIEL